MLYFVVLFLLMVLIFRYDITGIKVGRDTWYVIVLIILVLIAGLRWRLGEDTTVYLNQFYYVIPRIKDISSEDLNIGSKPLWLLLNSAVLSTGGRFWMVQLIHATVINVLLFAYFKKHCQFIFTCVFFYFIWSYFNQNMQEMKASFSVVLCLYGNDYLLEKKRIKGLSLYLLGCLFHFSTLLILVTPLVLWLKFNKTGIWIIIISYFMGFVLKDNFDNFLMMLDFDEDIMYKAEHWAEGMDKEWTIFYYLVNVAPYVIYAIISLRILKLKHLDDKFLKLEPFVILGIITFMIEINVRMFYRYTHFYLPYFIILFSTVICSSIRKHKELTFARIVGNYLFFLPVFFAISMYFISAKRYKMYYPYSSVIERKIDWDRENLYNYGREVPLPNTNEY